MTMKKILTTILTVFYLVLSSSTAISIHYCEGELENVNLNSNIESCCCGDNVISNSCCLVKELKLEIDIDQLEVSLRNIVPENSILITELNFGNGILKEIEINEILVENYKIPPPKLEAIWITNCSLTYYG